MKQGAYVLLIILIVAFVISGVFSSDRSIFPVVNWWNSIFNRNDSTSTSHSKTYNNTFSDSLVNIKINLVSSDLIITKEDIDEIEVDYKGEGELVINQGNSTLTIKEEFKSWNLGSISKGQLVVKIPKDLKLLETKTISGETTISNISADKSIIESVSGRIKVSDIKASDITIKSISGNIGADSLDFSKGFMKNVSGKIDSSINSKWEDFSLETVSGRISIELGSGITPDITFSSVSGKLSSRVTGADINCTLKVKTVSGDAKVSTK